MCVRQEDCGAAVYVCSNRPNGVTEEQYQKIVAGNPKAKKCG